MRGQIAALWLLLGFAPSTSFAAGEDGRAVYAEHCERCHGEKGDGRGPEGEFLDPPPRDFTVAGFRFDTNGNGTPGDDEDLRNFISIGSAAYGGSPLMAPFDMLSSSELDALVAYIRAFAR